MIARDRQKRRLHSPPLDRYTARYENSVLVARTAQRPYSGPAARSAAKPTTPTSQGIWDIKGRALGWLDRLVTIQDGVDRLIPRGPFFIGQTSTSLQQLFDNLQMIWPRFVAGRPNSCVEHIAAVHAAGFERSFPANEQPYDFQLPTIHGPVKRIPVP